MTVTQNNPETLYERAELIRGDVLAEASLSRLLRHIESGKGFMIVSAYRGDRADSAVDNTKANQELRQKLARLIRQRGYGYSRVVGSWVEQHEDGPRRVKEPAFFVANITEQDAKWIANQVFRGPFHQEAVIFGHGSDDIRIWNQDGSEDRMGSTAVRAVSTYFTAVAKAGAWAKADRGHTVHRAPVVVFESLVIAPSSVGGYAAWSREVDELYERCVKEDLTVLPEWGDMGWSAKVPKDMLGRVLEEITDAGYLLYQNLRGKVKKVKPDRARQILELEKIGTSRVLVQNRRGDVVGKIEMTLFDSDFRAATNDRRVFDVLSRVH